MQFADPQELATAYLILRHIYDGDVIEWPIADDHPLQSIFAAMEAQGYLARWDRTWPRRDRYRLTDKGIAAIEGVYKPAGAESLYHDLRGRNLGAAQRRAYLQQQGYDPMLWPLLHDPSTHWDMYREDHGRYHDWFWEDQQPYRRRRDHGASSNEDDLDDGSDVDDLGDGADDEADDEAVGARPPQAALPYLVDLDREANASSASELTAGTEPAATDYDVS